MTAAKPPTFTLTEVPDVWITPAIIALIIGVAVGAAFIWFFTDTKSEDTADA